MKKKKTAGVLKQETKKSEISIPKSIIECCKISTLFFKFDEKKGNSKRYKRNVYLFNKLGRMFILETIL